MSTTIRALTITLVLSLSMPLWARPALSTETQFLRLFKTSGYSMLYGAAIGTALLAFTKKPGQNLNYIAVGGSLGFLSGTILGTYVMVGPSLSIGRHAQLTPSMPEVKDPHEPISLVISPVWSTLEDKWSGITASFTLANL